MDYSESDLVNVTPVPRVQLRRRHQVRRALDVNHVGRLADVLDQCPPIVFSADGTLVDGEHRVAAAGSSVPLNPAQSGFPSTRPQVLT